jgi:hypothetical protein
VQLNCLDHITRAAWVESTPWTQHRADEQLIKPNDQHEKLFKKMFNHTGLLIDAMLVL